MLNIVDNHSSKWFIDVKLEKSLTKEQTKEYFKKYRNGDLNAREILITHNIRLVIYKVRTQFGTCPYDKEELVAVGIMGLIKAIDSFDIDRNIELTTYAVRCIENEIKMFMRKNNKYLVNESFDSIIDEETEFKLEKILYDENADFVSKYEDQELREHIIKIIDSLDERNREIMKLRFGFYGEMYNQTEIGNLYHTSQSYISKIISKNIRKILNTLCDQQFIENNYVKTKKRSK